MLCGNLLTKLTNMQDPKDVDQGGDKYRRLAPEEVVISSKE